MTTRPMPKYPIYVISKGRWESRLTVKSLDECGLPYRVVIEPQEYDQYAAVIPPARLLALPFSNLGLGSIPARNWVWEHSISEGHARHWILDDNINHFFRLYRGRRYYVKSGATFVAAEDFVDRYENVALAGMQYKMFAPEKAGHKLPPFALNTRIYSCILIQNDIAGPDGAPYRWRGRYNEDTDLSLRVLKDGWCTVLFYAFLAGKMPTMRMKGGNTDELYAAEDGRYQMALSLVRQHPDVTKITRKWGRWQHQVDYRPFKHNRLIKKPDAAIPQGVDEYGMTLTGVG
jgi:hypothetical protein